MTSNLNEEFPDLLHGAGEFELNNTLGSREADAGRTYYGSALVSGRPNAVAGFSLNTPLQWSPSQMNHALRNPLVQQVDMGREHSDRMLRLAVSQTDFPASHGSPALQSFENANDGSFGPGHSASHVRPHMMVREERGLADTRYIDPNSLDQNRFSFQENESGNMAIQAPSSSSNFGFQNQAIQATASSISWPHIQQQGYARNERMVFGSSSYRQSMQVVSRQDETPDDAMADGNPALVGMYGHPDSRSYARDMVSPNLDPQLLSDQMQGVVSAPSESLVCSFCQKRKVYRNRSTLRKHLETHDPAKTKRHKCDHDDGNCPKAFRYPKDLRRHERIVHLGLGAQEFVCQQPGCTAKYNREDNLRRHYRKVHSGSRSILSTDTESTAPSQFDDVPSSTGSNSLMQRSANPNSAVDHASSFTASQTDTSSSDGCIDPRLVSPTSASDSHSFSTRGPQYFQ